jgi:hypothetical protein
MEFTYSIHQVRDTEDGNVSEDQLQSLLVFWHLQASEIARSQCTDHILCCLGEKAPEFVE